MQDLNDEPTYSLARVARAIEMDMTALAQWMPRVSATSTEGIEPASGRGGRRKYSKTAAVRLGIIKHIAKATGCSLAEAQAVAWRIFDLFEKRHNDLLLLWKEPTGLGYRELSPENFINQQKLPKNYSIKYVDLLDHVGFQELDRTPITIVKLGAIIEDIVERIERFDK